MKPKRHQHITLVWANAPDRPRETVEQWRARTGLEPKKCPPVVTTTGPGKVWVRGDVRVGGDA